MKAFQQFLLSILLISMTLTSVSQPLLEYKDHERVFVIGVRHFENPVFVQAQGVRQTAICEKSNLIVDADKSNDFYESFWVYQPEVYGWTDDMDFIDTLVIPQLSDTSLVRIIKQQDTYKGFGSFPLSHCEKKMYQYHNLNYWNISCHRFLVILLSVGTIEKYFRVDCDPPVEFQEPKWGLYRKSLIPLFVGDTTCTCGSVDH